MTNTTNYNLKKPDTTDFYDVQDFNDNMDIIDGQMKSMEDVVPSGLHADAYSVNWFHGIIRFVLLDDAGNQILDDDGNRIITEKHLVYA